MGLTFTKLTSGRVEVTGGDNPYTIPSTLYVSKRYNECVLTTRERKKINSFLFSDVDSVDTGSTVHTITNNDELYDAFKDIFNGQSPDSLSMEWASTSESSAPMVIPQYTDTLIELSESPFASYNTDNISFDLPNDWVDVSGLSSNAWLTARVTFQGVNGDADVSPSVRLINNRNDLGTYFKVNGQTSIQQNGKNSSYIIVFFKGDTDVVQFYIETDKAETLTAISISLQAINVI